MSLDMSAIIPRDFVLEELREINSKLDGISKNIGIIRKYTDEQSFLLMLILAVHATNVGLIKPQSDLAAEIKTVLAERGIMVDIVASEPSKDPQ